MQEQFRHIKQKGFKRAFFFTSFNLTSKVNTQSLQSFQWIKTKHCFHLFLRGYDWYFNNIFLMSLVLTCNCSFVVFFVIDVDFFYCFLIVFKAWDTLMSCGKYTKKTLFSWWNAWMPSSFFMSHKHIFNSRNTKAFHINRVLHLNLLPSNSRSLYTDSMRWVVGWLLANQPSWPLGISLAKLYWRSACTWQPQGGESGESQHNKQQGSKRGNITQHRSLGKNPQPRMAP